MIVGGEPKAVDKESGTAAVTDPTSRGGIAIRGDAAPESAAGVESDTTAVTELTSGGGIGTGGDAAPKSAVGRGSAVGGAEPSGLEHATALGKVLGGAPAGTGAAASGAVAIAAVESVELEVVTPGLGAPVQSAVL